MDDSYMMLELHDALSELLLKLEDMCAMIIKDVYIVSEL